MLNGVDWSHVFGRASHTIFYAIFARSMILDHQRIPTDSRFLSEIESVYFWFTKCVERDPKMNLNGILAQVTNNGETLFNLASLVSERVSNDILERNIDVNYLSTRMGYPNFTFASLTQTLFF